MLLRKRFRSLRRLRSEFFLSEFPLSDFFLRELSSLVIDKDCVPRDKRHLLGHRVLERIMRGSCFG